MTQTMILALKMWALEAMALSLEVEDNSHQKVMETLTPKRVFMALSTRLKWLEPIKA